MTVRKEKTNKPKSIQHVTMTWFSILVIVSMLIFLMMAISFARNVVYRNSVDYTKRIINQVNNDLEDYIDYMNNISTLIVQSGDVEEYLFGGKQESGKDTGTDSEAEEEKDRIISQFSTILESRKDIYNIAVVADDGSCIVNDGKEGITPYVDYHNLDWYREAIRAGGTTVVSSSHVQNAIKSSYQWVITLSRALINDRTGKPEGVFFIDLNYSAISKLCNSSSNSKSYVFIIDQEGNVIYHPKQDLIYGGLMTEHISEILEHDGTSLEVKEEGGTRIYTMSASEKTGWTVVGVSDTDALTRNMYKLQISYISVACLALIVTLLISANISRAITRPILDLRDSMSMVQKGTFEKVEISPYSRSEIVSLGSSFNIMIDEIEHLIDLNNKEQEEKRKSELMALWAQIKPHFLYNTLDSIIWMSEAGQNQKAVLMTSALARLLRQSISNNREEISVKEELDYVDSYLTIQKMRYSDKLEYVIDVDEEVESVMIVKFTVQPLVENAIYHGLKYRDKMGRIEIHGFVEDGDAYLTVTDNGAGMDEDTLAHIFDQKEKKDNHAGIGIDNVQKRLQMYYGSHYGITYVSEPGEGTIATIVLPVKEGEKDD